MKERLLLTAMLAFALATPAQEAGTPSNESKAEPQQSAAASADSPLVAAAKKAKGGKIKAGIVVTNLNLKTIKGEGGGVVTLGNPADPNAPAYTPEPNAVPGGGRSKEDWQNQISSARGAVANAESLIVTLRGKAAKLENDFYAWDDPAYRDGVLKPAWDQAVADLEAARQALETAKQRIVDLEEEARKAGTPPGWLR